MTTTFILYSFASLLAALLLCLRAVISQDPLARRLLAVVIAFLPMLVTLLYAWLAGIHSAEPGSGGLFGLVHLLLPVLPAACLIAWAFRTNDPAGMRNGFAAAGLICLVPLLAPLTGATDVLPHV